MKGLDLSGTGARLLEQFGKLSPRERAIIAGSAVILSALGLHQAWLPVKERFELQAVRLAEAEVNLKSLAPSLRDFYRLKARRDEIEAEFKQVESRENSVSALESLLREKIGGPPGSFTIVDRPPVPFGPKYEETSYTVTFRTSSIPSLVEFLKELTYGKQRFLMPKLGIERSYAGDRLEVKMELKSIGEPNRSEGQEPRASPIMKQEPVPQSAAGVSESS